MDTRKFLLGSLVGGIVLFALGYLFYVVLFSSFFASHGIGNVMKDPPDMLFIILGNLASGALISYIFTRWAGIKTAATGLEAGAVIGLFIGLGFGLVMYGTSNLMDITGTIVDVLIYTAMYGIAGSAVGWFLGRGN